jgi:hypothetical protein
MPAFLLSLALFLLAAPAVAVVGYVFQSIWNPLGGLLKKFATPIAGALEGIENGAHDLQGYLRRALRESAHWFLYGEDSERSSGWPLRYVVKPLLALAICVTLLLIELDLGALGWAAKLGTGGVPDLHLPLALLQGMMLPLVGIAFAEAFFDIVDPQPVGPWSKFGGKARALLATLVGAGLVAGVVANVLFFAWRFGQLDDGKNPYDAWGSWINFLLGALLYLAPVVAGAMGLRFVTIVVPTSLTIGCGGLLVVEKAAHVARLAIQSVEAAGAFILTCLRKLGEQFGKLLEAGADAASTTIEKVTDWRQGRVRGPRRPGLCFYLGRAILETTRAFWRLVHDIVHGIGGAFLGIGRLVVAIVRGIGRGIRAGAIGLGRAARAVAVAVARAATAIARAIGTCVVALALAVVFTARALGRAGLKLVRPVGLLVVAVSIWLFFWPSRIAFSFLDWLFRFDFWTERMHFRPPTRPSPKKSMEWRLGELAKRDEASGIILKPFREEKPPAAVTGN